jgi:hypothetical protein
MSGRGRSSSPFAAPRMPNALRHPQTVIALDNSL